MQKKEPNKILKILWTIGKILMAIILVIVMAIIVIQKIFNNNVAFLGYRIFTVATGSMEPEYKVLDMLLVKEVDEKDIKIDDDLVYNGKGEGFDGKIITHRVIEIEKDDKGYSFTTKGIANIAHDPIIRHDQILGKVIYKSVVLSFINKIINNTIGFFILIIVPIVSLAVLEIIDYQNDKEREEEISG